MLDVGASHIFQSDNGSEFCNQDLRNLIKNWSCNVTFVNGRPRHSQSQGLVERGNRAVKDKISKMKAEIGMADQVLWAPWLPDIRYALKTVKHKFTKDMPYRVVFGRELPALLLPQTEPQVIDDTENEGVPDVDLVEPDEKL